MTPVVAALALKPLAPFSYNWVGGNIRGLAALAGTLYGYAPKMDAVADALDGQVGQLVNGAGWQGAAASSFKASWSKDSQTSRALGLATDQVGQIVDWLAVSLSMLESELEMAASAAKQHGVTIGANGAPSVFIGPTTSTTEKEAQEWGNWYQHVLHGHHATGPAGPEHGRGRPCADRRADRLAQDQRHQERPRRRRPAGDEPR